MLSESGLKFNIPEAVGNSVINMALDEEITEEYKKRGLQAVMDLYLEYYNVEPIYQSIPGEEGIDMAPREALGKKPGLIIANHPGYIDTPIILGVIERKDLKIVVAQKNIEGLAKVFGREPFISVGKTSEEGFEAVERCVGQVKSGGVVLVYPSGGIDTVDNNPRREIQFLSGFGRILRQLPEDAMVYSFWINDNDVAGVISDFGQRRLSTKPDDYRQARAGEPNKIRVKERLSLAREWQVLMVRKSVADNRALAEHYKEIFGLREKE